MAFAPQAALAAVTSFLRGRGRIRHVQVGEPKSPPLGLVTAAVFMEAVRTPELVLDAPVRVYEVVVRLYRSFLDEGTETETELAEIVGAVMEDLGGDADLGGAIRAVDVGGIYGGGLDAEWGHLQVDNVMFRMCDIRVPLIVDEAAASLAS